jgi:hypothetical protein
VKARTVDEPLHEQDRGLHGRHVVDVNSFSLIALTIALADTLHPQISGRAMAATRILRYGCRHRDWRR